MIYNIHTLDWDDELLRLLQIPRAMLPKTAPNCSEFGVSLDQWFGGPIPIAGMAGDQQAATFGQACFEPGSAKNTYGTGCFMLMNIGGEPKLSEHQLLTTIGWGYQGQVTYCLEGSVFVAGAVVQWLRDGLGLINASDEVQQLADRVVELRRRGLCSRARRVGSALLGSLRTRSDLWNHAGHHGRASRPSRGGVNRLPVARSGGSHAAGFRR